jgi:hypothetical protein
MRRLVIPLALCIAVLVAAATAPARRSAPKQTPQVHASGVDARR